ncbi:MAG: SpoIIE family protein phosphatase [Flavobacteriales bacterium]|nr:SpoIIE family protein phosphatase [Flavobacteriales bacterium]
MYPNYLISTFFACILYSIAFTGLYAQNLDEYHEQLQEPLKDYRPCALASPDSCDHLLAEIIDLGVEYGDYDAVAKAVLIKGIGYAYANNAPRAIETFKSSVEISQYTEGASLNEIQALSNIANMYISIQDTNQALYYFDLALLPAKELGEVDQLNLINIQIAQLLIEKGQMNYANAKINAVKKQLTDSSSESTLSYYHLTRSEYFSAKGEYQQAKNEAELALAIYEPIEDFIGIISSNAYVGQEYLHLGNTNKAIEHCQEAYDVATTNNLVLWKELPCECLYEAYQSKGNYRLALNFHKELSEVRAQKRNDEKVRRITTIELEADFRETRFKDSVNTAQIQKAYTKQQQYRIDQERSRSIILFIGLGSVGVLALLLFIGLRSKKKDNKLIREQKNAVEQKQREILDSISYAKRLQNAILPSQKAMNELFSSHFVYYAPKDVVSGDFYWCEQLDDDKILFGTADCTGHGVPAALVSVVCSNAITRSIREFQLEKPSDILDNVSRLVEKSFGASDLEVKDGMDIGLCLYDKSNGTLQFAGANNPLWIIRKNELIDNEHFGKEQLTPSPAYDHTLIEFKGDRQPIGRYPDKKPFQNVEIQLQKDDLIYLFSDGIADQFGGNKGKKFKYIAFKKTLMECAQQTTDRQKQHLHKVITNWQGNLEQTDDICVLGVKLI